MISYYTCALIIKCAGNDAEYYDTLFKYWGKPTAANSRLGKKGYYAGLLSTTLICVGAHLAYFIYLTTLLYPLPLAMKAWTTGNKD